MPARPCPPITLALVNDYELVVHGLAMMLRPFADRVTVVDMAVHEANSGPADIALYDTFAADLAHPPEFKAHYVVLWTVSTTPEAVEQALTNRAAGVLWKGMAAGELVTALERIAADEVVVVAGGDDPVTHGDWPGHDAGLSEREAEILALICQGLRNEQIADRAYLSINTVKSYIRSAYRKMDVSSRSQAVLWGIENGFRQHAGSARFEDTAL
jgi:DNA-binding NarL/FixJ family response regulator